MKYRLTILMAFIIGVLVGHLFRPSPSTSESIVYVYTGELPEEEQEEPDEQGEPEEEQEEPEDQFIIPVTEEEIDLLSRLVSAEARGESYEGMVAVANVVINRLRSPKWKPDTIKAVIYEPRQFQPVKDGSINKKPTEEAVKATMDALKGKVVVPEEVDCFAHKSISFKSWAKYHATIDNHKFWISK